MARGGARELAPVAATGGLRQRVSYNAVVRLAGRSTGAVISLVALRIATRYFGPPRWGLVVAASALANLFVGVCDFGLLRIVSREIAADEKGGRKVYGGALAAAAGVSVVVMAVMVVASLLVFLHRPAIRSLSLVLVLSLPPNALWLVSSAVFVARARNDARAVIDVLSSLFLVAAAASAASAAFAVTGYVWLTVAADAAAAVASMILARAYLRADFRGSLVEARRLITSSAPVGLTQLLVSTYTQTELVLLSLFVSSGAVGDFGVSFQAALFGISVPSMLTAALVPKFVGAPPERQRRLMQRALDVLVVAGAAIPLFAVVFARGVILAISGPRFSGAVTSLMLLSCFAAVTFPSTAFTDGLIYLRAERRVLRITAVAMVANLVAAAAVIPFFGADGAALVITGSAVLITVLAARAFRRSTTIRVSWSHAARYAAIAAALLGVYWMAHDLAGFEASTGLVMIPEMLVLAVVYGAGALAVGRHELFGQDGDGGGGAATSAPGG